MKLGLIGAPPTRNGKASSISAALVVVIYVSLLSACGTNTRGLDTVSTADASTTSYILWQGQKTLETGPGIRESSSELDLDNPTEAMVNPARADLEFEVSIGSLATYFLQPINGARAMVIDGPRSFEACLSRQANLTAGARPELLEGTRLCVLSDEHRLAGITIGTMTKEHSGITSILLDIVVWSQRVK